MASFVLRYLFSFPPEHDDEKKPYEHDLTTIFLSRYRIFRNIGSSLLLGQRRRFGKKEIDLPFVYDTLPPQLPRPSPPPITGHGYHFSRRRAYASKPHNNNNPPTQTRPAGTFFLLFPSSTFRGVISGFRVTGIGNGEINQSTSGVF